MCTFAWTWKDTISKFCINDGELVGNIWEKKEEKRREENVEKGFAQFGTLPLAKALHLFSKAI
jgi:hypothetical protein